MVCSFQEFRKTFLFCFFSFEVIAVETFSLTFLRTYCLFYLSFTLGKQIIYTQNVNVVWL